MEDDALKPHGQAVNSPPLTTAGNKGQCYLATVATPLFSLERGEGRQLCPLVASFQTVLKKQSSFHIEGRDKKGES